jgi:hypothetical protein
VREICEISSQWKKAGCGNKCLSSLLLWGVLSWRIAVLAGLDTVRPYLQITRAKRAASMAHAAEHPPSKWKTWVHYSPKQIKQQGLLVCCRVVRGLPSEPDTLPSNPSTTKTSFSLPSNLLKIQRSTKV